MKTKCIEAQCSIKRDYNFWTCNLIKSVLKLLAQSCHTEQNIYTMLSYYINQISRYMNSSSAGYWMSSKYSTILIFTLQHCCVSLMRVIFVFVFTVRCILFPALHSSKPLDFCKSLSHVWNKTDWTNWIAICAAWFGTDSTQYEHQSAINLALRKTRHALLAINAS